MKRVAAALLSAIVLLCMGACPFTSDTTTVRLVNNASFPVEVRLFYGDNQHSPESVLETFGHKLEFTIEPGDEESFSRDCDELQSIFIKKAELSILGDIGPSASTSVYRDGTDFGCGDSITFTFTQSALATELHITFSR